MGTVGNPTMSTGVRQSFDISRHWLLLGIAGSTLVQVVGKLLGLAIVILLARVLGPADFGQYAFVLALAALLGIPAQAGLPTLVIRETARLQRLGQWSTLRGLWRWSSLVALALAFSISALVIGWVAAFPAHVAELQAAVLAWGLMLIPLVALNHLRGAALSGLRHVVIGQLPEGVLRPSMFLVLLLGALILWPQSTTSALAAVKLAAIAAAISLIISTVVLYYKQPSKVGAHRPTYRHTAWFTAMWPLALVAGLQVINSHTDILMIGLLKTLEEVGIYRVVAVGATLVVFPLHIVNATMAPHIARLHAAKDTAKLQAVVTRSARLCLLGALLVGIVILMFGQFVLATVFGPEYTVGYVPLLILTAGQLFNAAMGSVGLLLNMTGHERETAKGVAVAVFLNVPLNLVLIPWLGMNGAAIATVVSIVVWNVLLWRAVHIRLGISSLAFAAKAKTDPT